MHIDNSNTEVVFRFKPKDYFLVYGDNPPFGKEWWLAPRIDRSYKGKNDDLGCPVLHLTDEEAEVCKKAGFTYVHMAGKDEVLAPDITG